MACDIITLKNPGRNNVPKKYKTTKKSTRTTPNICKTKYTGIIFFTLSGKLHSVEVVHAELTIPT